MARKTKQLVRGTPSPKPGMLLKDDTVQLLYVFYDELHMHDRKKNLASINGHPNRFHK
jgi:hypothetical protein